LIQSFRDRWLRDFYLEDKASKKIPAEVEDRLFRKLQLIDDATCDLDLRSPPSNHFEKLRGNLAGKHSIRVNKQWRLVFTWSGERGEVRTSIWITTIIGEAGYEYHKTTTRQCR
jgi:proteic killer suppression protein